MAEFLKTRRPRRTIREQINRSAIALIILLLAAGGILFWQVNRLAQATNAFQEASVRVQTALKVQHDASELQSTITRLLPLEDATIFENEVTADLEQLQINYQDLLTIIAATPEDDPTYTLLIGVSNSLDNLIGIAETMLRQARAEQWPSVRVRVGVLARDQQQVVNQINQLVDLTQNTQNETFAQMIAAQRAAVIFPAITVALAVAASIFLTWQTTSKLVSDVEKLTAGVTKIAAGFLEERVNIERDDEIGQLADAFNQMAAHIQTAHERLEEQVAERTHDLQRRAVQLQTAAEVGSAVASIRDLDELLTRVTHLISERFGFYHTGIFLLDDNREYAVLRAANSPGGQRMLARGHRLKVGEVGIVGHVTATQKPRIALDVGRDATFFNNPDLPDTHSEMALPLVSGGQVLGALDVQSTEKAAFTEEDIPVLQLLADQLAIAIENARLFARHQAALAEAQSALETARQAYRDIGQREWRNIIQKSQRLGILAGEYGVRPVFKSELTPEMAKASVKGKTVQTDAATIAVPIKIHGQVTGVIRLRKADAQRWHKTELDLVETLTDQLSVALESARLYQEAQQSLEEAEKHRKLNERLAKAATQLAHANSEAEAREILVNEVNNVVLPDQISLYEWLPEQNAFLVDHRLTPGGAEDDYQIGDLISPEKRPDLWEVFQNQQPSLTAERREDQLVHEHYILPWYAGNATWGVIELYHTARTLHIREEDQAAIEGIIQQSAVAIQSARNFDQTQRRALQLQTAAEVAQAASSILDLNELLPRVVELITARFGLYYTGIFLVDDARKWAVLRAGSGEAGRIQLEKGHRLRLDQESMIGRCIVQAEAQIAQQLSEDVVYFQNPYLPDTRAELALPLTLGGKPIGAMTIQSTRADAFTPEDITVLQTLADQLAIAIENARFLEETRLRAENEQLLNQISAQLSRSLDLDTILQTAVQELGQIAHVQEVSVHIAPQEPPHRPNGEDALAAEESKALTPVR